MATYKIPSLLPTLKAPTISVSKDEYTNPQPIIDRSYAKFNADVQKAIVSGITKNRDYILKEKEDQRRITKENAEFSTNQFQEVVGLADTGNSTFDQNKQNYFYSLKDRYIKIKNMMDENPDFQQEGAKYLAMINNEISQFQKAAPQMLNEIVALKDALKIPPGQPGAISSEVPGDIQRLLLAIVEGGPNVTMVNKNGNLVLYAPPQTYKKNGETFEYNGAEIDINKFLNLSTSGGDFIQTIPDYQTELKEAADAVIKTTNDKDNPLYYTLNEVSVGENKNATVKEWNAQIIDPKTNKPMIGSETLDAMGVKIKNPFAGQEINGEMLAQMDMIRTGAFESLLRPDDSNDNDISVLWTDVIGTDSDGNPGQDSVWDPTNKDHISKALGWLSQQAVNEYGIKEGVLTHQNKPVPKTTDVDDVGQEASYVANDLLPFLNDTADREDYSNYFINKTIGGKRVIGVNSLELGKEPGHIELIVAVGKEDSEPIPYNLNNPASLKNLIHELVKGDYGNNETARKIRSEIQRMLTTSKKKKKEKTEVNTDYSK